MHCFCMDPIANQTLTITCTYHTPLLNSQLDSFAWSMVISSQSRKSSVTSVLSDIPTHSLPAPGLNSGLIGMSVVSLQFICFKYLLM